MNYDERPRYHYKPKQGWINDPNGLVYFQGYYHAFYQHTPHSERPWQGEMMHWGHARTKDFLHWEELPVALTPDQWYEGKGCWSGTAIVRDGTLYLFYASVYAKEGVEEWVETISVATSTDGIHFQKYAGNPVISTYPLDGSWDFRDPAVLEKDGKFYLFVASGNLPTHTARLLVYESDDLLRWIYRGVAFEWADAKCAECPSVLPFGDGKYLLTVSVCKTADEHFFSVMVGTFDGRRFRAELTGCVDCGPDQYAGQAFRDPAGRCLLLAWIPGWKYQGYASHDVGCLSLPRELCVRDGRIVAPPAREVRSLLTESDPCVRSTPDGFRIERTGRDPVVYRGDVRRLQILRDAYLVEVFVNDGEAVVTALL